MKTRHLFTFALAAFALSFAACSDDDDVRNVNSEPQPGEKGALVEGISINFGESQGAKTRAYSGTEPGQGTEGLIYEAFIFAKEANPLHSRPLTGDWTVVRVTVGDNGIAMETGGIDTEKTPKAGLTKAINASSTADVQWLVKDVAKFRGVRQGDYVYVIANDPNLTLAQATAMAHAGETSEEEIKGYTAALNKDYLNGLTFLPEAKNDKGDKLLPSGRFIMAGREMIPVSPNIPSNGEFSMTIGLDRELSKVNFTAEVSTNQADAACGKVAFQEGDGIVVARIARKASPFTEQTPDWYVPANNYLEDWPINNHALAGNNYAAFCDGTREGSFVFDGTSATPITDWITGTTIPAGFNNVTPGANVTEYRYSWKLGKNTDLTSPEKPVYLNGATLNAPIFYTTPNYSANTNSVTVICTQATYIDRGVFSFADMADKYVDAALAATDEDITLYTAAEITKLEAEGVSGVRPDIKATGITVPNMLKKKVTAGTWGSDDITAPVKSAIDKFGLITVDEDTFDEWGAEKPAAIIDYATYKSMMDRFYVAVLLQQRIANKMVVTTVGEDPGAKKVLLVNAATDSLLLGWRIPTGETDKKAYDFHIEIGSKTQEAINAQFDRIFEDAKADPTEANGIATREFFTKLDAYEYIKGQKLYYRADVADYVGGTSNKITERNMYYTSKGTIQSLGAKSIHDAIYSDQNTMHIDVKVNDWKLSINKIPM